MHHANKLFPPGGHTRLTMFQIPMKAQFDKRFRENFFYTYYFWLKQKSVSETFSAILTTSSALTIHAR